MARCFGPNATKDLRNGKLKGREKGQEDARGCTIGDLICDDINSSMSSDANLKNSYQLLSVKERFDGTKLCRVPKSIPTTAMMMMMMEVRDCEKLKI